jgi:DNA-binding LytR/AlgR family response regulator
MADDKKHILIVEDEVLIASQLKLALTQHGYECSGIAINFNTAVTILKTKKVDLVLIDVTLSGEKTGLDLAEFIAVSYGIPFLFITSYNDKATLDNIKKLNPIGYINKPVNEATLLTTLDILFNNLATTETISINIALGNSSYSINLSELLYVESDHVYLKLYFTSKNLLVRSSLKHFLSLLPNNNLIQISRGVAINPALIEKIESSKIIIADKTLKLSKKYRENLKAFI